jgi:hypothetical protein
MTAKLNLAGLNHESVTTSGKFDLDIIAEYWLGEGNNGRADFLE